ncbi:MAG: CPBP family intramembrane metalloprotease [Clostridia bacterium]|nr:CPBP family intramembrane metalloprotease [Clostridia bacterium]
MKQLYDRNELMFSIAAILLYVIPMANLRGAVGDASPWSVLYLAVYAGLLTAFLAKHGLCGKYGLTSWPDARRYLYFVPLVILSFLNLRGGAAWNYPGVSQLFAVGTMLLVGYVEEVVFRGLLFKAIAKDSLRQGIVISVLTFGIGHISNLFTGHEVAETLLQVLYAVAIGFLFVTLFHFSGSLWPCIITHSLIDVNAVFVNGENISWINQNVVGPTVIVLICVSYSLWIVRRSKRV